MKQSIMQNQNQQNIHIFDQPEAKLYNQSIVSDRLQQYLNIIESKRASSQLDSNYVQLFMKYGVFYNGNEQYSKLNIKIKEESISSEAIVLQIKWGKFASRLTALNVDDISQSHRLRFIKGGFGKIYFNNCNGEQFVIKCIHYSIFNSNRNAKIMAIGQLFLMKIASALKVGPLIKNWLGFDLIIYSDCIQFAMQKCCQIQVQTNIIDKNLKQNLQILHKFCIIHYDLKPQNIMFSPTFKKYIYIDYGLSQLIKQNIGTKSLVNFKGTLDFTSPQMINIFEQKTKKYIDLYYNDAYSLEKAIMQIKSKYLTLKEKNDELRLVQDIQLQQFQFVSILRAKYLIIVGDICNLTTIFKQRTNQHFTEAILDFLLQVNPTSSLKQFYSIYIDNYYKQSMKFAYLHQIYNSKLQFKMIKHNKTKRNIFINSNKIDLEGDWRDEHLFDKITMQKLLKSQNNSQIIDRQMYIRMFIDYISFSNNIYQVSTKERAEVSFILMQKYYKQMNNPNLEELQIIELAIRTLFLDYIQSSIVSEYLKTKKQKKSVIKQNIADLLQHLFILKIPTCDEVIFWLNSLYSKQYWTIFDKIQFLLHTKFNSYWYIFSINTRFDDEKKNQMFGELNDLIYDRMQQVKMLCDPNLSWVINFIQNVLWYQNLVQMKKEMFVDLPSSLIKLLKFLYYLQQISYNKEKEVYAAISSLYEQIPNIQRQKLFFFLFLIFKFNFQQSRNIQKCQQIMSIFYKNINNSQIQSNLLFAHFINCTSQGIIIHRNSNYLQNTQLFFNNMNYQIATFHCTTFKIWLFTFFKFMTNLNKNQKLQIKQQTITNQVINRIQQFQHWFHFDNIIFHGNKFIKNSKRCIDYQCLEHFIYIRKIIAKIINQQRNIIEDLIVLLEQIQNSLCRKCILTVYNTILMQKLKNCIYENEKKQSQREQQVVRLSDEIQSNINYLSNADQFKKMLSFLLIDFCSISPQYQLKYKGIRKLYHWLKQNKQLQLYLSFCNQNMFIIVRTIIVILFNETIQQLAYFLNFMTEYLTHYYSQSYFELIFTSYSHFINYCSDKINFISLFRCFSIIQQNNKNNNKNMFNIIYYYIFLFYMPLLYRSKCILKIVQTLDYLHLRAKIFFQSHLYIFMYSLLSGQCWPSKKQKRRTLFLKYKIVKLLKMYEHKIMKLKINFNKKKRQIQIMQMKALLLGGPYQLTIANLKPIYVTVYNKDSIN